VSVAEHLGYRSDSTARVGMGGVELSSRRGLDARVSSGEPSRLVGADRRVLRAARGRHVVDRPHTTSSANRQADKPPSGSPSSLSV
jgi:hypothetical protein